MPRGRKNHLKIATFLLFPTAFELSYLKPRTSYAEGRRGLENRLVSSKAKYDIRFEQT